MTEEYRAVANGGWMWLACTPGVAWVCFQAGLFLKRSITDGRKMGITDKQMKKGIKNASIASIGPCLVLLSSMLSLMVITGEPLAWLRINVIGGVGYEIMGANLAATAMNIKAGTEQMTVDYLCSASIVMTVGCLGWILFAALFSDKMERVNHFMAGGNKAMIPLVSAGCVLGCYSNLVVEKVAPLSPATFAAIGAAGTMMLLLTASKKWNIRWLKDWALSFAMIVGVLVSILYPA